MTRGLACAWAVCLLIAAANSSPAEWLENGTPVCIGQGNTTHHQLVSNGYGGAIIVWEDYRGGASAEMADLYAAHVNRFGTMYWTASGISVCTHEQAQLIPQVVSDGSGGAIIVWLDLRVDIDVYAQRLDAYGNRLWTADGHVVCAATSIQNACQAVADGYGGVVVVWEDYRSGNFDIYAQRIDGAGNLLWGVDGLPVCTDLAEQTVPHLTLVPGATAAETSIVVAWEDDRDMATHDLDIYAQRLSLGGVPQWPAAGVQVCGEVHQQDMVGIVPSSDGSAIVAWLDHRFGLLKHVFVQRVTADGFRAWETDGVNAIVTSQRMVDPDVASDQADGILIAWERLQLSGYSHASAQRIDAGGNRLWAGGGGLVLAYSYDNDAEARARVIPDGSGGGLFGMWTAAASLEHYNISAKRVLADGVTDSWSTNGRAVCLDYNYVSRDAEIVDCGLGGAMVVWRDTRNTGDPNIFDLYIQRVETVNGHWGNPDPVVLGRNDVPDDNGGWVRLDIRASDWDLGGAAADPILWYNVWRLVPDGLTVKSSQAGLPGMPDGDWESLGLHTAIQQDEYSIVVPTWFDSADDNIRITTYLVTAHTGDPDLYFVSQTADAYSFDNLPPPGPQGLTVFYRPGSNMLAWGSCADDDCVSYRIYRGDNPGFIVAETNLIGWTTGTVWTDQDQASMSHHYKLTAVDDVGNESDPVPPDNLVGVQDDGLPGRFALLPNVPNPFNPSTTIPFDLPAAAIVSLCIYNAEGSLVRILANGEQLASGQHTRRWDGTDASGRPVAAGVYFCRLDAGPTSESRPMVMIK